MTSLTFSRGAPPKVARGPSDADLLPLSQKEDLCRGLLAEFGVTNIRARHDELIHGCLIDPTHTRQESDPTASLNFDKLLYNCFGCGSSGGLVWLIAQCRSTTTDQARSWLAKESGLDGQVMELDKLLAFFDAIYADRSTKLVIPTYSTKLLDKWAFLHPYLTDPQDAYGRGIPEPNVMAMKIGYAADYPIDDRGRTSERIVLPHFWKGDLVGWQTRRLIDDGTPKYLSSADFPRESTIYNYQPRNERTVLVESMLSVVSHLHALPEAEATFGANVTDVQMRLLAKHQTLVLFMDNDKAGWKATEKIGEALMMSINVLVVENPYAADPDDMSTEDVLRLVAGAVPHAVWKRPQELLCYRCRETAHEGRCETERG